MRVLLACSMGGTGHLGPLVPFADAAAGAGDDVRLIVPPGVSDAARATGHRVWVGSEPGEDQVAPLRERLVSAPPAEAAVVGDRELFGRLATAAMLPAMQEAFSSWGPELVLRDPCEYASALLAERTGVRYAHVGISMAATEASVVGLVEPVLEPYQRDIGRRLLAAPYLTRFPPSLDPSPWADTRRFAEPRPGDVGSGGERLDPWADPAASGGRRVYVTLGTVTGHTDLAADAWRTVLAAAGAVDADCVATIGRRTDPASLGPVPANVRVFGWVPQAEILAGADLVVCHGGSGTTYGALAAGVPVVVLPLFADQWANGRTVAASGAGITVEPATGRPRTGFVPDDVALLSAAVRTVLGDPAYKVRALAVAAEMAGLAPLDEVYGALRTGRWGRPGR